MANETICIYIKMLSSSIWYLCNDDTYVIILERLSRCLCDSGGKSTHCSYYVHVRVST